MFTSVSCSVALNRCGADYKEQRGRCLWMRVTFFLNETSFSNTVHQTHHLRGYCTVNCTVATCPASSITNN
ncbi:hypothetical protein C0557_18695 [Kosakonia sp. MUSA4]|nr:hypothetical protein C0557_18695 [Kosakonia sp. MUSA4]